MGVGCILELFSFNILRSKVFKSTLLLVSAFLISAISSLATGTAWGSASTAGIALISIAHQLNIDMGMAAGAIIAGAVFGDKMSPLSDTTNLAALVTKVNIFLISDQ